MHAHQIPSPFTNEEKDFPWCLLNKRDISPERIFHRTQTRRKVSKTKALTYIIVGTYSGCGTRGR